MKGTIKAYSPAVNAGCITDADGNTYTFGKKEWRGAALPRTNEDVTFTGTNARATEVKGK